MYEVGPLAATRQTFETRLHPASSISSPTGPVKDDGDFQRQRPAVSTSSTWRRREALYEQCTTRSTWKSKRTEEHAQPTAGMKDIPNSRDEHVEKNTKSIANSRQEKNMANCREEESTRNTVCSNQTARDPRSGRVAVKGRNEGSTRSRYRRRSKGYHEMATRDDRRGLAQLDTSASSE